MNWPVAVVFDLDGTLVDSMAAAPTAYADTVRSLGGDTITPADVLAVWHIGPAPVVLGHLLDRPITPQDMECYYDQLGAAVTDIRTFPGVTDMLDILHHAGYKLGVYTAATKRAATLTLAAAGLNGRFGAVVGGDEISKPKPSAEGLHATCHRLGVRAAETAYIGDAAVDLDCARAAGAIGIHASWGCRPADPDTGAQPRAHRPHEVVGLVGRAPS